MSKVTITSISDTPTPETSGESAGSATPQFHLDSADREAQRYNPIEFLSWARSIIKYSEIRGGEWSFFPIHERDKLFGTDVCFGACIDEGSVELFDVAGIICCWQDYILNAFRAELEAMKAEGELQLYGLDKPETLTDIEQGECIHQTLLHFNSHTHTDPL